MTKTIEVEVFGQRFSLQGEGEEEYFHKIAGFVDEQMRTLAQQSKTSTPTTLAILAAINIADQLFKKEHQQQSGDAEIDRRAQHLLETIEKHLTAHPN